MSVFCRQIHALILSHQPSCKQRNLNLRFQEKDFSFAAIEVLCVDFVGTKLFFFSKHNTLPLMIMIIGPLSASFPKKHCQKRTEG